MLTVPVTEMNPATIGPTDGPANGARANKLMACPRWSVSQMSASKAPLFVNGALAKHPPRNRKIRMEAVFLESAQPIWKHMYTKNDPMKTGRRPYDSDSGPHRSGPTQ